MYQLALCVNGITVSYSVPPLGTPKGCCPATALPIGLAAWLVHHVYSMLCIWKC